MGCAGSQPVHAAEFRVSPSPGRGDRQSRQFHSQYFIAGKLGRGAFAQVHLVKRVSDGRELAAKVTDLRGARPAHRESGEPDGRTRRAVEKEVSILKRVGAKPHCVEYYEDFSEGIFSYVVMEKCDLTLLQALECCSQLTERVLARLAAEMLQAISSIHRIMVVHRDVKPDNFLCSGERRTVKLCDFGLAEVLPSGSELRGVYGTAPFMSPEMLGAQGYDAKTDVWSLGVMVYVLLLGQFPYQPLETTARAMKAAILTGMPAPSFRPRASLDVGNQRISDDALGFVRTVVSRDKHARPTAHRLLQHSWIASQDAKPEQWGAPSLRPMLYAAKRTGAFDTRAMRDDADKGGMDAQLAALQAQHHGASRAEPARAAGPRRADKPHSESSLEVSGKVVSNESHLSTATGSSMASFPSRRSRSAASRDV